MHLITKTGNALVDRVLEGVVDSFSTTFPHSLHAIYLTGSWSNGTAVYHPDDPLNSSDLDLHLVFRPPFLADERHRAEQLMSACQRLSPLVLEEHLCSFEGLEGYWDTSLKQSSLHLFGDDIRDQVTLPPLGQHLRRALTFPPYAMAEPRRQHEPRLVFPLSYPDPHGEFYGYDHVDARYSSTPSTRTLVSSVTWAATVILALQADCLVGNKWDAVQQYRERIHDQWSGLIETVFTQCKLKWQLQIPTATEDRNLLRSLCQEMLGLENHLLTFYRAYLFQERAQNDVERQEFAREMLGKVLFRDVE